MSTTTQIGRVYHDPNPKLSLARKIDEALTRYCELGAVPTLICVNPGDLAKADQESLKSILIKIDAPEPGKFYQQPGSVWIGTNE